jgi:outer membrane immunogenic protein
MQLRLLTLATAAIGLCAIQHAFAGKIPVKAPVHKAPIYKAPRSVPVVDNWSGWYFGGHLGGGWTHNNFSDPTGTLASTGTVVGARGSGFLGGPQLGYNWQVTNWVFGIQGDISFTRMNAQTTAPSIPTTFMANETKWISTLTGRVGFASDRMLWYAKGGEAWVRNNYSAIDSVFTTPNATAQATRSGYVVGGGWEYAFAPSWSTFIEYDYIGLSTKTLTITDPVLGSSPFDTKQNIQMVKAGVNYKFWPWRLW